MKDLNITTKYNILFEAATQGNAEVVKLLLAKEVDVHTKNMNATRALHIAAFNGHTELVQYLLEQEGVDINARDEYGNTGLHWAALGGHIEALKLLLEAGIDITIQNNNENTALHRAAKGGHVELVKYLLGQKGVDINARGLNKETILHTSVDYGHIELVKYLSEQKDIDINARDEYGNTGLHIAAMAGDTELVEILLEQRNIAINTPDNDGNTALEWAIQKKPSKVAQILFEKGANFNTENLEKFRYTLMSWPQFAIYCFRQHPERFDLDQQTFRNLFNEAINNQAIKIHRNLDDTVSITQIKHQIISFCDHPTLWARVIKLVYLKEGNFPDSQLTVSDLNSVNTIILDYIIHIGWFKALATFDEVRQIIHGGFFRKKFSPEIRNIIEKGVYPSDEFLQGILFYPFYKKSDLESACAILGFFMENASSSDKDKLDIIVESMQIRESISVIPDHLPVYRMQP